MGRFGEVARGKVEGYGFYAFLLQPRTEGDLEAVIGVV